MPETHYECKFYNQKEIWMIYVIKTDSEGNVENTSTIELPTSTSKRELIGVFLDENKMTRIFEILWLKMKAL